MIPKKEDGEAFETVGAGRDDSDEVTQKEDRQVALKEESEIHVQK